jgi:hypothetical protein
MRGTVLRLTSQDFADQCGDSLIVNRSRLAGAQFIVKPPDTIVYETAPPFAHSGFGRLKALCNALLGSPLAHASTMRARCTNAAGVERERAMEDSCACSASLKINSDFGRPIAIEVSPAAKIP